MIKEQLIKFWGDLDYNMLALSIANPGLMSSLGLGDLCSLTAFLVSQMLTLLSN